MKWFKHFSSASHDEFLESLIDDFGLEGYARWWLVLESIASQMDTTGRCHVEYSWVKWQTILKGKRNKLETFLEHCQNESKLKLEQNGNKLKITCPKLLNLRDNYSRNLQVDEQAATPSASNQEGEVEGEVDNTTSSEASEEEEQDSRYPNCPYQAIVDAYHVGCPDLKTVRLVTDKRKQKMKKIWRLKPTHQDVNFWIRYFSYCGATVFLQGRNDNNWSADFDWLINVENFAKVVERKYEETET